MSLVSFKVPTQQEYSTRQNSEHIAQLDAYWLQEYQPRFPHPWVLTDVRFELSHTHNIPWRCTFFLKGPLSDQIKDYMYEIINFGNTPSVAVVGTAWDAYLKIDWYNNNRIF